MALRTIYGSEHRHPVRRRKIYFHQALFVSFILCILVAFTFAQDDDDPTSSIAQVSQPFIDQTTGLQMQRFFGARTSFGFAFALSTIPSVAGAPRSFIGQLSFPLVNGEGWGAMGLTGDMEGNFILAVWPDGNGGVMASFRQASDEDDPPEVVGDFRVRPLPDGTVVNNTALSYTFLCESCIDATLGLTVDGRTGDAVMGWALSERPPLGNLTDPGAFLGFHERGFGPFTARLGAAATPQFEDVAATALSPVLASKNAVEATTSASGVGSGNKKTEDDDHGNDADSDDERDADDD